MDYEELFDTCPGVVGKLASFIIATSIRPQPGLALASALAFVGTLKGHRVQTQTGLRTNFLFMGVAPSGSGKDRPLKALIQLAQGHSALESLLIGKPRSDAGLLTSLVRAHGRALLLWDEIGLALERFSRKQASGHEKGILDLLVELFSCANVTFLGGEYANADGKRDRIDIEQPLLNVYGTSTPESFFNSLSSFRTVDGFAPRLLVVLSTHVPTKDFSRARTSEIPKTLLDDIININNMPINNGGVESLDFSISPRVVPLAPKAQAFLGVIDGMFEDAATEALRAHKRGIDNIYHRGVEHSLKVALTLSNDKEITEADLAWAYAFVGASLSDLVQAIEARVADNDRERAQKRLYEIVLEAGEEGIAKNDIVRRARSIDGRLRDQLLSEMCDVGDLRRAVIRPQMGRPTTVFVCPAAEVEAWKKKKREAAKKLYAESARKDDPFWEDAP